MGSDDIWYMPLKSGCLVMISAMIFAKHMVGNPLNIAFVYPWILAPRFDKNHSNKLPEKWRVNLILGWSKMLFIKGLYDFLKQSLITCSKLSTGWWKWKIIGRWILFSVIIITPFVINNANKDLMVYNCNEIDNLIFLDDIKI